MREGRVTLFAVTVDPPLVPVETTRVGPEAAPRQAERCGDGGPARRSPMSTTRIVNADLVIAYDVGEDTHVYRRDCDVVFDETRIAPVGAGSQGAADTTIDGRGFMVMPGLVNVHSHPGSEAGNKGLTDEVGSPKLYNTSLYEYLWLFRADAEGIPHTNRMAWSELLM